MILIKKLLIDLNINSSRIIIAGSKKILSIILILITIKIAIAIINKLIYSFFKKKSTGRFSIEQRRADTLVTILKSIARYTIYFIGLITIASLFIDVTSLIAVAGVGSLAVGFGAQSLVRDIVTGFFIFFEDQFSVGDYISIGNFDGIVELMGLRTTLIRAFNGDLHIIPNGEITHVINHSRGNMRAMVDVAIAYEQDIQKAIDILNVLCEKLSKENNSIIEGPYVLGVQELGDSSVNIRITAQTVNMEQWAVERFLRQKIKETFDKEDIEIPYPRNVVYYRDSQ